MSTLKKLFNWNMKPIGDPSHAQAILVHASGVSISGFKSPVNEMLSAIAVLLSNKYSLPILAQGEVADAILATGRKVEHRFNTQEESLLKGQGYVQTKHVAQWHEELCRMYGWTRVILISYQGHLPRAYWVTKKLGWFDEIIIPDIPGGIYDKNNSQFWWRNPFVAWPREIAARLQHILLGIM